MNEFGISGHEADVITLGSSPNVKNFWSVRRLRAVLIISLHFFGVSSTFPAKNKQQQAVTWKKKKVKCNHIIHNK